ncbi:MAG: hypothetical protein LIP18_02335, partial [Planctomycetes bacterium]|nr:hypothetical protein [Planctomycetota bacterium]
EEGRQVSYLYYLAGGRAKPPAGRPDDDIYVMMNASRDWRHFVVPDRGREWRKVVDTSRPSGEEIFELTDKAPAVGHRHDRFAVEPQSVVVLVSPRS